MNSDTLRSFSNELVKVAGLAGMGNYAKRAIQGGIRNAGNAVSSFSTPVKSTREGAKFMVNSLKRGAKNPLGMGMAVLQAHGLYSQGKEALRPYDSSGEGKSRLHRTATLVGDQVGGLIGARHGIAGQLVASAVGRKTGDLAGKVIDFARGHRPETQMVPGGMA